MPDYVESFEPEDQERVFRFFALFSRWECALKRCQFARSGSHEQAEADWDRFADEVENGVAGLNACTYVDARDYLLTNPPKQQHFVNRHVTWQPNPKRLNETDARYLFRVIRDVRNNLFHGGKYQDGLEEELARDRRLLDVATTVLEACMDLDARIRRVFDEEA